MEHWHGAIGFRHGHIGFVLVDTTLSGYRLFMSLLYISLHVHTLLNCTYSNEDSR
jgi:hypothetical protein